MFHYFAHILVLVAIYTILAGSLNLVSGYTGLVSIAHAAFYSLGAYLTALLPKALNDSLLLALIVSAAAGASLGALTGLPALRVHGDSLAVTSLGFQVVTFNLLNNLTSITGGPMGITGVPRPGILSWHAESLEEFLLVAAFVAIALMLVLWRIVGSPYGRLLKAIREDEVLALVAGKAVASRKLAVFVLAAAMASMGGVLYAYYFSFVDPTAFTVNESILILAMMIVGGAGTLWGPVVGASTLVVMPEILRFLGLPGPVAANLRQLLYGAALVACMLFRPQGIAGGRTPWLVQQK